MNIASRVLFATILLVGLVAGILGLTSRNLSAKSPNILASFPKPAVDEPIAGGKGQRQTAVLSGGCFWGVQAVYQHTRGVISATSGYAGGNAGNARYELVGNGNTGHAESVKIVYDPGQITYGQILMIFFSVAHNPTELNKQGPDWGTQYRSSIFYATEDQNKIATAYIAQLEGAKVFSQKIVTQVVPLNGFYAAEAYHQDYAKHHPDNPYIAINDLPKVANLKKQFPELYREN
jgi:peptide-methionine (S)-S-oxide reductase